jgi:hypothetical protein
MLQPLLMLLVASTSQKCGPSQGYNLNLACNVRLPPLTKYSDHSSLYVSHASIAIPFVGSLKILPKVRESKDIYFPCRMLPALET